MEKRKKMSASILLHTFPHRVVERFAQVSSIAISRDSRFAAVSFDRDESTVTQRHKLEFDMVSRPFVRGSDPSSNLPSAVDVGAFKARVAIFDMVAGRYIDQDVMLSSEQGFTRYATDESQPGRLTGPISILQVREAF